MRNQSQDREGAPRYGPAYANRPRGRGHRVNRESSNDAEGRDSRHARNRQEGNTAANTAQRAASAATVD